jgi:hypothetical protein
MAYEIIETAKYIMKVHDDCFIEYKIKEGANIDAYDVIEGKKEVVKLWPGTLFYVLAEGVEFFTMTREARAICASPVYADNTIAIAFYTTNVSVWLLGEMYNKINKPVVPTKIFNNRESALEWLNKKKQGNKALNS